MLTQNDHLSPARSRVVMLLCAARGPRSKDASRRAATALLLRRAEPRAVTHPGHSARYSRLMRRRHASLRTQTVVERSRPLLKIIPTLIPVSKDQLGAMMLEAGALAALAAVMMIGGFKVILFGLSG